jgi:hypothetical protein
VEHGGLEGLDFGIDDGLHEVSPFGLVASRCVKRWMHSGETALIDPIDCLNKDDLLYKSCGTGSGKTRSRTILPYPLSGRHFPA